MVIGQHSTYIFISVTHKRVTPASCLEPHWYSFSHQVKNTQHSTTSISEICFEYVLNKSFFSYRQPREWYHILEGHGEVNPRQGSPDEGDSNSSERTKHYTPPNRTYLQHAAGRLLKRDIIGKDTQHSSYTLRPLPLKTESGHDANFVQRQRWHHDDSRFPVSLWNNRMPFCILSVSPHWHHSTGVIGVIPCQQYVDMSNLCAVTQYDTLPMLFVLYKNTKMT